MNQTLWKLAVPANEHSNIIELLSETFSINTIISRILVQRGIDTIEKAEAFLYPTIEQLHNPFLMKDMDKAVQRLTDALQNNEKILIYGDYDVDGTTAIALVYSFLQRIGGQVLFYVPDRYTEGYGVSLQGIDYAEEQGCTLVITLDCGIKASRAVNYATDKNIDVIICDHHEPGENIPEAWAVLDPKREDCAYPFKELSGCGVGYKFMSAYSQAQGIPLKGNLHDYLDLLAISIASDIVPIEDENRVLMYYGLKKIVQKPTISIQAITKLLKMGEHISVADVVFKIGPLINAAGRVDNAKKVVELLLSIDSSEAEERFETVFIINEERKKISDFTTKEAISMLATTATEKAKKTNVLHNPSWRKGVAGIVASKVMETFYKPTIIFCGDDDIITASARSVRKFDLYAALEQCEDLLTNFGGHTYAAGLSLRKENFAEFVDRFEHVVSSTILPESLVRTITIDATISLRDIHHEFYTSLQMLEPFGPKNMTPIFLIKHVHASRQTKIVGSDKSHVKFEFFDTHDSSLRIQAIGFGMAEYWKSIMMHAAFDICCVIKENTFRNTTSLQLEIRDIAPADSKMC